MELIPEILAGLLELVVGGDFWSGARVESCPTGKIVSAAPLSLKIDGNCAYCRKRGGHFVTCVGCRAPHHRDCARLNKKCAVYGCSNRKFLVPSA